MVFGGRRETRCNAGGQGLQPPVSGGQGLGSVWGMHGGTLWLQVGQWTDRNTVYIYSSANFSSLWLKI
jgi:hypothetical protein